MKIKHLICAVFFLGAGEISRADIIYLADTTTGAIDRFDSSGAYLGSFAGLGPSQCTALALDNAGNIYVANSSGIGKFDSAGDLLSQFPLSNTITGLGLALDSIGNIYVTESGVGSTIIEKCSSTGTDLGVFATITNGTAAGLAFDSAGNLYVAIGGGLAGQPATENDLPVATIEKFNSNGNDLGNFIQSSSNELVDHNLTNITFDTTGNLYAIGASAQVAELDSTGNLLTNFADGSPYSNEGVGFLSNGELLSSTDSEVVPDEIGNAGSPIINAGDPSSPFFGTDPDWTAMAIEPTPEPGSLTLLGMAAVILAGRRKRVS